MPKLLNRIIILLSLTVLAGCGSTDLPVVTQIPFASASPLQMMGGAPEEGEELANFAATGAECGIDEREVATMVYLPRAGRLGDGVIGCSIIRPPSRVRDKALHRQLWALSKALIPDDDENRIERVVLAQDRRSETLAFVATLDDEGRAWEFGLNLDAVNLDDQDIYEELLSTIIHEYAHILSLNDTQVSYSTEQQAAYDDFSISDESYEQITLKAAKQCLALAGIYDGDACYRPDSHMYMFFQTFWESYGDDSLAAAAAGAIYDENPGDFVNDYAGTSPTEDFAETFAAWLMPDHSAFEITDAVRAKFEFFEGRIGLTTARDQIAKGLRSVRN